MKIRALKASILFQMLLLLIFITPYLIKSGISRHILFPTILVMGILLAHRGMEAFKEYLHEQVKRERETNFATVYSVFTLSLGILVPLSISLALIVGKNGYSKNISGVCCTALGVCIFGVLFPPSPSPGQLPSPFPSIPPMCLPLSSQDSMRCL